MTMPEPGERRRAALSAARTKRGAKAVFSGKRISPYLFLLPFLSVYIIFILYPIIEGLYVSLTSWDMMSAEKPFVGLKNFKDRKSVV